MGSALILTSFVNWQDTLQNYKQKPAEYIAENQ